ncbi:MAG TPA: hypothetical protein VFV87_06690 [Pirellulaceae bacterium]|nr:hypothetical protein [Pirellulaceae bacterium]
MLRFEATVHSLRQPPVGLAALSVSFEAAYSHLAQLPRLFIEPDGSFVWRGSDSNGDPWQVDGNLIDRGDALAFAEIKGCCPSERLDELLTALGWPEQRLVFQLPQRGVVLDEADFRRQAAAEAGAV